MDIKNRQYNIQKILLRAWRERWPEFQFGINIKDYARLPADSYCLTDVLLEQCLIGSGANKLLLAYLKHSLHSHLVSYPAVIKRITKYCLYERSFCITALLEFLISIVDAITCRTKPEESSLMNAILSLLHWLMELSEKLFLKIMEQNKIPTCEQQECLNKISQFSQRIVNNQYLMGVIYLAKLEDRELYEKCIISYKRAYAIPCKDEAIVKNFYSMVFVKFDHMPMKEFDTREVEPICFGLQPFISIEVLINASVETSAHVSKLLMIQKLKKYSLPRLYCEIIRSCFITLCHVKDVNYRVWGAFTLYKVPQIIKQLSMHNTHGKASLDEKSTDEDVAKAFEMLLECTPILDLLDTTFACNSIECILIELKKLNLVTESTVLRLVEKRQAEILKLEKFHIPSTTPSLDKYVASMEPPLSGLISSLKSIDQIKKEFLDVLCTLAVDNRAFLLYSVAAVKGKHRTIINGLMKCNESFKEISGDAAKNKQIFTFRSNVFDISFIMLFSIMQKSGIDKFQTDSGGDYFFEKWVRDGMIYSSAKLKSPLSVVKMSDASKVDELITYFSDNSLQQPPPISFKLGEICNNIPAMLYNILIAWENDTIKPQAVKNILENMRQKMCCFSVVAACWLCAYMKILRHDELEKPKAMVQQLMMMPSDENIMKQETFSERFSLTQEIIMKLFDTRSYSKKPMNNLFNDQWNEIITKRWLPYDVAINLEELLKSCGPFWLMKNIVDQIMSAKFIKEMDSAMDIAFSIMHLNIEACTETLLRDILISMLYKNQLSKISEPQSKALAKLCVYAILSTIEAVELTPAQKKRPRPDDDDTSPMSKMRKTGLDQSVESGVTEKEINSQQLKENLKSILQDLFKVFHQQVVNDELSPKVNFIFQFFSLLVQYEKSTKIKNILKLIPNGLIMHIIKLIPYEDLTFGFILRLYDLSSSSGRALAISDLCLLKNLQIRRDSSKL